MKAAKRKPKVANMSENHDDHAGVIAHPPFIYLGGVLFGFFCQLLWPLGLLGAGWRYLAGVSLIVIGFASILAAGLQFHRAGTSVPTHTPTTAVVTHGLYALSRNPIYVALTVIYLGIAFAADNAWILIFLAPVLLVMQIGVIHREERYLERKFGEDYRRYKERVRRWL